ncbi:Maf family protein [Rubritalea marina]|uniref:Maf family protein n=1 Tax=Rubritalea marina TaxID=361055 RepID=UPI00037AA2C4|nr:Maf family protein [Rubritalea marina]
MQKRLILASESPRRQQLLAELGFEFDVIKAEVEELHDASMGIANLCETNAALKAREVVSLFPYGIVLAGDTLVALDGEPLGKPKSLDEAREMLRRLSGSVHQVCTGMCVAAAGTEQRFHQITEVHFKSYDDAVIEDYIAKVNVMDKAGSYGIQHYGDMLVEQVVGDYSNVVGMPQELVHSTLIAFGVSPKPQ